MTKNNRPLRSQMQVVLCITLAFLFGSSRCPAQPFDEAPRQLSIMSWNVEWMFDHYTGDNRSKLAKEQSAPSQAVWEDKLSAVAAVIGNSKPDIVGLQEIEGGQTLASLAAKLKSDYRTSYRYAFIQGSDSFTEQDVGVLVRGGLVAYGRREQSRTMYESNAYYNLSKHMFAEFRWANVTSPLTLLNIHLRATEKAEDLRVRQARLARRWVEDSLIAGQDVIVLGDFNSESKAGQLRGEIAELTGTDEAPKMVDLLTFLKDPRAATHLILDRQFDRVMVSQSLLEDGPGLDWNFSEIRILTDGVIRGRRDGPEHWEQRLTKPSRELDVSDHFPIVATFELK